MCMSATCPTCSKQTWRGCGNHVPSVFANVPEDQWCTCEPKVEKDGKQYPPQAQVGLSAPSWLKNLVGGNKQ